MTDEPRRPRTIAPVPGDRAADPSACGAALVRRGRILRALALLSCGGAVAAAAGMAPGCSKAEGCMGGDDGACVPPSPCTALAYSCDDASLELRHARGRVDRPPGMDALAANGDVILANGRTIAVIDAIRSPHHLAHTGGTLIDLVPRDAEQGTGGDELNQMLQTVGILPYDQARYETLDLIDESPTLVAVVARGHLDGRPEVDIVTRYELRPCEPGVRIRTEVYHGGRDPEAFFLADAFWWGDREVTPFVPLTGQGFVQPDLDIMDLDAAMFSTPFMAAQGHAEGAAAYGVVRCDAPTADAFQSTVISAAGRPRSVLMPGDSVMYERFVTVAHGPGLSGAANRCRSARSMLFGEPSTVVRGRTVLPSGEPVGGDERVVTLLFYEPAGGASPDDPAQRTPHNEAVPAADGSFSVLLPAGRRYRVEPHVLGRPAGAVTDLTVGHDAVTIGDLVVPPTGMVDVEVTDSSGEPVIAEVVLTPSDPATASALAGSVYGQFAEDHCVPYLGPPFGGSPGCNRVLVGPAGSATFAAPEGTFYAYATRGPFATLARELIEVRAGERTSVALRVDRLVDLLPPEVVSADFHVHAGASFDSSFPERERALTFIASDVQVVAATDHDVATTYASAMAELGLGDQVVVIPGVETTGQILFYQPPGWELPQVIGHFNFWPVRADYDRARNGAPFDELMEPGALFDRVDRLFAATGIRQLNHPFAESLFGRDEGFWTAIRYDPRFPVPAVDDGTAAGQLARRPAGGSRNADHHVQEVMNGASTRSFQTFRAGWHSFLNQGQLRAGTANSDAHTLATEVLGYPRNLVFGGHVPESFELERFTADVRAGRMVGTNGPVLLVCAEGADGECHEPSLSPFQPGEGAALQIEVRAAPWIPVHELRIVVNGRLVRSVMEGLAAPGDPFGRANLLRYRGSAALDELLSEAGAVGDAWIVVEAGMPSWPALDLDDDGLVDTTDNNGDGVIDPLDREGLDEDDTYRGPPVPEPDDERYHLHIVAPGTYPTAFTNPLLIDRAGDGWSPPGL